MRARARRHPRGVPSLHRVIGSTVGRRSGRAGPAAPAAPRVVERVAGARHHLADGVRRVARAITIIVARGLEIGAERRRLLPTADVVTLQNALVLTAIDPPLQL